MTHFDPAGTLEKLSAEYRTRAEAIRRDLRSSHSAVSSNANRIST